MYDYATLCMVANGVANVTLISIDGLLHCQPLNGLSFSPVICLPWDCSDATAGLVLYDPACKGTHSEYLHKNYLTFYAVSNKH